MIKGEWKKLDDNEKFAYVQMSRADRERALYVYKLSVIKDNLIKTYPEILATKDVASKIDQKIKDELENVVEKSSEDESSDDDELSNTESI